MRIYRRLAVLCSLVVAGCGGGGGGGGSGSDGLSIGPLSPASVVTTVSNDPSTAQLEFDLTATYTGTTSGTLYVVVVDPDGVFTSASVDANVPSKVTLALEMSGVAPTGHYTKPLVIHVCHDAQCASEFPSFPRTVQKDVTIQGTTTDVSSLSFTSSGGIATGSQSVKVTPPAAGVDFDLQPSPYVDTVGTDGSSSPTSTDTGKVFAITKTATGFDVQGLGSWPAHYKATVNVVIPGYQPVPVTLDYQVGAVTAPIITSLTTSVSGSAKAGVSQDIPVYVEFVTNVTTATQLKQNAVAELATNGSADPGSTFWLRYFDQAEFTDGTGPENNATRMRFFFNPCLFSCLPAGHYTANITVTGTALGTSTTITVPATFDITP